MLLVSLAAVILSHSLTPGVVRPLSQAEVCSIRWGVDARHVSESMRKQVFARYHIPWEQRAGYIVDHLVPRELAGADDVLNLWPQLVDDAKNKDVVENVLHRMVCGEFPRHLTLQEAQRRIAADWHRALIFVE